MFRLILADVVAGSKPSFLCRVARKEVRSGMKRKGEEGGRDKERERERA